MKKNQIKIHEYMLGLQHVCAMFGATVLVPVLTGLDVAVAILAAGIATLIFHIITKYKMPVFLGSSFAFIPVTVFVLQNYGVAYLKLAIVAAGLVYVIVAIIVKQIGTTKIKKLLPHSVVGPVIISIGLKLAPVALAMAGYKDGKIDLESFALASFTLVVVLFVSFLKKSTIRLFPVLIAIIAGYIFSAMLGYVDFTLVHQAHWFGFSAKSINALTAIPKFSWEAIFLVAPISLVVFMEHIGDVESNGAVVGKNFIKDPGLHRSLMGDGVATIVAGLIGGPSNTTYSENTGVLAATKNYDPRILRIAAVFAIILSCLGKVTAIVQSIPTPVMGGISVLLFGLISSIGIKTLVVGDTNFNNYKNLVIPAIIIIIGVFIDHISITDTFAISGLFLATIAGIILNVLLPNHLD